MSDPQFDLGESMNKSYDRRLHNFFDLHQLLDKGGAAEIFACKRIIHEITDATAELIAMDEELVAKKLFDRSNGRERRFHEEAQFLQKIRHPNIIGLVDYFPADDCMILRRAVCSLQSLINSRTFKNPSSFEELDTRRMFGILFDAISGLKYLHDNGIVHRDICPNNILIDKSYRAFISDLGMSTVGDTRLPDDNLGNPKQYAPWEQSHRLIDARKPADIFAFSMVCYNLLAGSLPKGHPTPLISDINPEVPKDLATVLHRCLAFDPEKRPDSAAVLRAFEVFNFSSSEAVIARVAQSQTSRFPTPFSDFFGVGEIISDNHYQIETEILRNDYTQSLDFMTISSRNVMNTGLTSQLRTFGNARFLFPRTDDAELMEELVRRLGKLASVIEADIEEGIQIALELRDENSTIEVRLTDFIPPWRMAILDKRLLLQRMYGGDRTRNHLFKVSDGPYKRRMGEFFEFVWNRQSYEIN